MRVYELTMGVACVYCYQRASMYRCTFRFYGCEYPISGLTPLARRCVAYVTMRPSSSQSSSWSCPGPNKRENLGYLGMFEKFRNVHCATSMGFCSYRISEMSPFPIPKPLNNSRQSCMISTVAKT